MNGPHSRHGSRHWRAWALALVMLYAAGVRLAILDRPLGRNSEGVGCFYGTLARNYLRYPWGSTYGAPIQSVGWIPGSEIVPYAHHPPLVPLLIAGSYALLGEGDWQTRLPTALFTLGCMALIYWLAARRGRPTAGLLAALLLAVMPMTILYGGHPDCINPQIAFFALLSVAAYQRLLRQANWRNLLLLCIAFALAAATDWPAFFLLPVLCGHWAITHRPRRWWPIVLFGAFGCAVFTVLYAQCALALHDWGWMKHQLARRTVGAQTDREDVITLGRWLDGALRYNLARHTWPVLGLALAWVIRTLMNELRSSRSLTLAARCDGSQQLTALLWAWAILHIFVGRQGVLTHDWWWWPLTLPLALSAGLMLDDLIDWGRRNVLGAVAPVAAALLLLALGVWTTRTTLPYFFDRWHTHGWLSFSVREMGEAIRLAPPNTAVVLCFNDTYELQLWYYGERPLMLGVWDADTLEKRAAGGVADLAFGFTQKWPARPLMLVLPREFADKVPAFVAYLDKNYAKIDAPPHVTKQFFIYAIAATKITENTKD